MHDSDRNHIETFSHSSEMVARRRPHCSFSISLLLGRTSGLVAIKVEKLAVVCDQVSYMFGKILRPFHETRSVETSDFLAHVHYRMTGQKCTQSLYTASSCCTGSRQGSRDPLSTHRERTVNPFALTKGIIVTWLKYTKAALRQAVC